MRKMLFASALTALVASALLPATAGARTLANGNLQVCVSEGAGQVVVIGPTSHRVIGPLNTALGAEECQTVSVPEGEYSVMGGKYLTGPCYQTVKGELVNPPTLVSPKVKCEGKVHHFHIRVNAGPTSTIESDEVTAPVIANNTVRVSLHVTDVRYFECTDDDGTNPTRVCEPEGDTEFTP